MKKHRSGGKGEDQNQLLEELEEVSCYLCIFKNLPADLTRKIFSRLQFKFVVRCKVVCRAWYNFLSAPDFMHHYAENTPFTTFVLSHRPREDEHYDLSFVEISENGDGCTRTTIEPKIPGWPKRSSYLTGSCNGVLCLLHYDHNNEVQLIYIYNPTSGECISLPEHRFWKNEWISVAYKFGFSPSTNNFKVLRITKMIMGERVQKCEIFTVGVDHEWRRLEYPLKLQFPVRTLALNGARVVCWFDQNKDSTNIAAFDFGEEKFGHISPPLGLVLNYKKMVISVLNHRLCLVDFSIPSHDTLWTMDEYGVAESWTEMFILRSCFPSNLPVMRLLPVGVLRNGNIIYPLPLPKGLVSYSPKQKECTVVEVPDSEGFIIYTYISEFTLNSARHC